MPQASDEDRARMERWFGDIGESGPIAFLESHGYVLTPEWFWVKPTRSHNVSEDEFLCLSFLCDEWDFGGWG